MSFSIGPSEPAKMMSSQRDVEIQDSTSSESTPDQLPSVSWKNWLNLVAYLVNTAVTYTSVTGAFGATNSDLSKKYQTLVTPSGWAFAIWGPIFIWELVFVVAQFFPRFRQTKTVVRISPWWWALCGFQCVWSLVFAQDWVTGSLLFMFSILISLLGISWSTDGQKMSTAEYFLLRAPFSLQLGWIIVASTLSVNVQADALSASQESLLALAVLSTAALLAIVTVFTLVVKTPDPIIGLVAAWAFAAIRSELNNPVLLNDPTRFNPSTWDVITLGGLAKAALGISVVSVAMAVVAASLRILKGLRSASENESDAEKE